MVNCIVAQADKPVSIEKKPYTPPVLTPYGPVRSVIRGDGSTGTEGKSGMTQKTMKTNPFFGD